MLEAKEGCAGLEDVDERTFSRFGQYLYTTDYAAADSAPSPGSSDVPTENLDPSDGHIDEVSLKDDAPHMDGALDVAIAAEPVAPDLSDIMVREEDEWGTWGFAKTAKTKSRSRGTGKTSVITRSKKSLLWEKFERLSYPHPGPTFKPRKNRNAGEDYTAVFLGHARLYVFADKYDIESLRSLCLHKLHQTLVEFTLHDERLGDVVELLRYSYSDTAELDHSIDSLRLLTVQYAACVVERLLRHHGFQSLLEDAGPLAKDLFEEVLKKTGLSTNWRDSRMLWYPLTRGQCYGIAVL